MKAIFNILIILLLGLLSSTYSLKLSPIDYRDSIEIQTPVDSSTLRLVSENTEKILNPESIVVKHTSEKDEVLKSNTKNLFTASIYKDDKLILENINNLELVNISSNATLTINKDNPILTTLDISQKKLGLEDGTYKIVFKSNLIANSDYSTLAIDVTYDNGGDYVPAIATAPNGTKGLTLYFTTPNADALIPVTRFSVEDKSLTRMAIQQLQNGPSDTNLKTVIGDVTNCTYNDGKVVIDIPSSYTQYNSGSTGALLAHDAFVKSIFAVDRYWPIHSVRFTVDRKKVETYFHGLTNSDPIANTDDNYLLYLSYKVGDRFYLFDSPVNLESAGITDSDTIESKAQKLFGVYSNTGLTYGRNPIPVDIILNSAKLEGNCLILDFNENFSKSYENKDNLKLMMIDSLVYTFTSIPNVDGIKITVNNNPLTNFVKDRDLSGVLTQSAFINPEVAQ